MHTIAARVRLTHFLSLLDRVILYILRLLGVAGNIVGFPYIFEYSRRHSATQITLESGRYQSKEKWIHPTTTLYSINQPHRRIANICLINLFKRLDGVTRIQQTTINWKELKDNNKYFAWIASQPRLYRRLFP